MSGQKKIKPAKKKDTFLNGQSVIAQALRILFFGEQAGKNTK